MGVPLAESENPEPKLPLIMAPIPEPYCWDESFAVFYKQLDDEHKGLVDGIFAVAAAPGDAGKLDALKGKVVAHFTYEESQFGTAGGYGNTEEHKKKHADFLAKAGAVTVPVDAGTITFMKQWLVDHITQTDLATRGSSKRSDLDCNKH